MYWEFGFYALTSLKKIVATYLYLDMSLPALLSLENVTIMSHTIHPTPVVRVPCGMFPISKFKLQPIPPPYLEWYWISDSRLYQYTFSKARHCINPIQPQNSDTSTKLPKIKLPILKNKQLFLKIRSDLFYRVGVNYIII